MNMDEEKHEECKGMAESEKKMYFYLRELRCFGCPLGGNEFISNHTLIIAH